MLANGRIFLGERDKIFGIRVEERVLFLSTLFRSSFPSSIEPVLRIFFKHHEDGFNKDLAKGHPVLYACRRLECLHIAAGDTCPPCRAFQSASRGRRIHLADSPTDSRCRTRKPSEMEKAADAADTPVLFFSAIANFRPRARKTMCEEFFTHFIINTRAISTSAISINNAFSCYLQIFHSFIGHLCCFVANFLVLILFGLFCLCYFNRFFHLWFLVVKLLFLVTKILKSRRCDLLSNHEIGLQNFDFSSQNKTNDCRFLTNICKFPKIPVLFLKQKTDLDISLLETGEMDSIFLFSI